MSNTDQINLGRELFKKGAFSISKVTHDSALGVYSVCVQASMMLTPHEIEAVKSVLYDELGTTKADISFDFSALTIGGTSIHISCFF